MLEQLSFIKESMWKAIMQHNQLLLMCLKYDMWGVWQWIWAEHSQYHVYPYCAEYDCTNCEYDGAWYIAE